MQHKIVYNSTEYGGAHFYGGFTYENTLNDDTNLQIGNVSCGQLTFATDIQFSIGDSFEWNRKIPSASSYSNVGTFIVDSVETDDYGRYRVVAYDNISKFDIVVDSYLDSLTWPIAASTLYDGLCTYCGCLPSRVSIANANYQIPEFTYSNITGRALLGYLAQIFGGNIVVFSNGLVRARS